MDVGDIFEAKKLSLPKEHQWLEKILRVDCVGARYQDDGNLTYGPARKFFYSAAEFGR